MNYLKKYWNFLFLAFMLICLICAYVPAIMLDYKKDHTDYDWNLCMLWALFFSALYHCFFSILVRWLEKNYNRKYKINKGKAALSIMQKIAQNNDSVYRMAANTILHDVGITYDEKLEFAIEFVREIKQDIITNRYQYIKSNLGLELAEQINNLKLK